MLSVGSSPCTLLWCSGTTLGCQTLFSSNRLRFLYRRRSNTPASTSTAIPATPPTTPPTIGPVLSCEAGWGGGVRAAVAVPAESTALEAVTSKTGFVETTCKPSSHTPFLSVQQSPASTDPGAPQHKLPSSQRVMRYSFSLRSHVRLLESTTYHSISTAINALRSKPSDGTRNYQP
jgi:hypothetical protein